VSKKGKTGATKAFEERVIRLLLKEFGIENIKV
jgi:hypothetical protein